MSEKKQVKVVVTGGRYYSNAERVHEVLAGLKPDYIAAGDATGADEIALLWAIGNRVWTKMYMADWSTHGRAAGPIRNRQMLLAHQDAILVAFPGGKGTANCVEQARRLGMEVIEVKDEKAS